MMIEIEPKKIVMNELPDLIKDQDVQLLLKVSRATLIRWRKNNKPPQHYNINGRMFYDKKDILEFLDSCKSIKK